MEYDKTEFGMNRNRVKTLLDDAIEFYKFEDDINTTDDFGFCHVFYDKDNAVYIERIW